MISCHPELKSNQILRSMKIPTLLTYLAHSGWLNMRKLHYEVVHRRSNKQLPIAGKLRLCCLH